MAKLWQRGVARRIGLPLALLLTCGSLAGCFGWFTQLSTTDGSSLYGISCPSASTCFAVGTSASGQALVQQTSDAGGRWSSDTDGVSGPGLDAVSCGDVNDCVATSSSGSVLFTSDGGATWASTSVSSADTLSSVACPTSENCWTTVSAGPNAPNAIEASANGGQSWVGQNWSPPPAPGGYQLLGVDLDAVTCPTASQCVAVGLIRYAEYPPPETTDPILFQYDQLVVSTTDGGQTWNAQPFPGEDYQLTAVSCGTPQDCVAVGDGAGYLLSSDDSGAIWTLTDLPGDFVLAGSSTPSLNGVDCPDTEDCIAVGESDGAGENTPIIATTDGGATWSNQETGRDDATLRAVACTAAPSCWAVGSTSNGSVIVHTLEGGFAWPSVSGVNPDEGAAGGGTPVTITGAGFLLGAPTVSFGSTLATDVTVVSNSELTAMAPPAPGSVPASGLTVDVTVANLFGTSPLNPYDEFTYGGAPEVRADGAAAVTSSADSASVTLTPGSPGDLLVASVATYNGSTVSISGAGLSWTKVLDQADTVTGDGGLISVWDARAPSTSPVAALTVASAISGNDGWDQTLDVTAYAGAAGVGSTAFANGPDGPPPSLTVVPQDTGSWIATVGFDADSMTTVTPGVGQSLDGTFPDTTEDAQMWFQHDLLGTTASHDLTVGDTLSPTGRWDLGAVEILPAS